jgi:SAM-dependent methyltransferase
VGIRHPTRIPSVRVVRLSHVVNRRLRRLAATAGLLARSFAATRYAAREGAPGLEFAAFGRSLGLRALLAAERGALELLVTPVSIVRYWEFPFALRHLPQRPGRCLDISSPRLFSFYVASRRQPSSVRMLNPDRRDADVTRRLAARFGFRTILVEPLPVSAIEGLGQQFDSIWSISVIEHIPEHGDTEAMQLMYSALAPEGTLIVTVPVDRRAWDEYRTDDVYALGVAPGPNGTFFQRWYDEPAIASRLLDPLGPIDARVEWFGERVAGRFAEYESDWLRRGRERTVDDPREIANWYLSYRAWGDMPGQGVCGIVLRKPA